MPGATREIPVRILQDDFSGGVVSRLSSTGARGALKALKDAMNFWFRPKRAVRVRPGSRDISSVALPEKPTSGGKFYASGANKLFVGTDDGASGGKIFRLTTTGVTQQTLAAGFTATNEKWRFEQANGILTACQRSNSGLPQWFGTPNPAETWYTLALPKPSAAITFNADSAGGALATGKTYYWRLRYRYTNGSSLVGTSLSAGRPISGGNLTANLVIPLPGSPRVDYVGWTLERTDQNGTSAGPFYFVADGTAATYQDGAADSTLGYRADETLHGEPVAMDGVIFHKSRLWGWRGSTVYLSQLVIDDEGTGLANWVGDLTFDLDRNSGDSIVGCVKQGDRLLFGKGSSLHVIEGDDLDSFRIRRIFEGAGYAGPRSACSVGPTVFFYAGRGRLFVAKGDSVSPWLVDQLGDQLELMDTAFDDDVLAVNFRGQQVRFAHRRENDASQRYWLVYDLEVGAAYSEADPPAIDAIVQKDTSDFGGATLLCIDPTQRNPNVTTAPSQNPSFAAWSDLRGASIEVYAEARDAAGALVSGWTANGTQVGNSTGAASHLGVAVCGDGSGGTILVYHDNRSGTRVDLYAQRFNAAGVRQWASGGVVVCNAASLNASNPLGICPSGDGGAVVMWPDSRDGLTNNSAYAQRINADGTMAWTANGVKLYQSTGGTVYGPVSSQYFQSVVLGSTGSAATFMFGISMQNFAAGYAVLNADGTTARSFVGINGDACGCRAISDGLGGFIFAYKATDWFVRRLGSTGATTWTTNATAGQSSISTTTAALVSDGAHGAFLAWFAGSTTGHARAQRITSAGLLAWVAGGIQIGPGSNHALGSLSGISDGAGGAAFAWQDATALQLYAQRISGAGLLAWGPNALNFDASGPSATDRAVRLSTDGAAGAIAVYPKGTPTTDVYATRIVAAGTVQWTAVVCNAAGNQSLVALCFTDTPEAEYPPSANAGYHVWAAFDGTRDFRALDGSGGSPIRASLKTHKYDGGLPERVKDADRIELIVNRGAGEYSITVEGDPGVSATLSLQSEASGDAIGIDFLIGVSPLPTSGESTIDAGLEINTEGRTLSVTLAGDFTEEVEIGGLALRALALPWEVYS